MTTRPYFAVVERYVTRPFSQEALAKELEDAMGPIQRTILLLPQAEFKTQIGYSTVIYRGRYNWAANTFTTDPESTDVEPTRGGIAFVVYGPTYVNYIALEDLPWMLREAARSQLTIALVRGGFRGERGRIVFQGREQYEMGWNDTERCVVPPSPNDAEKIALENSLDARILVVPEDRIDWAKLLPESRLRQLTAKGFRSVASNLNDREEFILWDRRRYPFPGAEFRFGASSKIRRVAAWLETEHPELTVAQRLEILVNIADILKYGVPIKAILPLPPAQQQPRAEYRNALN